MSSRYSWFNKLGSFSNDDGQGSENVTGNFARLFHFAQNISCWWISLRCVYILDKTSHNWTEQRYALISGSPQDVGEGNPQEFDFVKSTPVRILTFTTAPWWEMWLSRHLESGENLGMSDEREKISFCWVPYSLSCIPDFKAQNLDSRTKNFRILDSLTWSIWSKFYNKRYFVPQLWEEIFTQNLIYTKICLLLTCFLLAATRPQKRSKNHTYRQNSRGPGFSKQG